MKQKVFLTGSTSYLGTKFVELYSEEFDIFGISRSDELHPIDLLDFEAVKNAYRDFQPDIIIHIAADLGRDSTTSKDIMGTIPGITKNLLNLAILNNTPFVFTSTEAIYGGKEEAGEYQEIDSYKPRSPYGASKVESEKLIVQSGMPYLITRGHRYVGISKDFNKPKQFPDTMHALASGQEVHLDSKKLFKPTFINNLCEVLFYYTANDLDKQIIINVGIDKTTTYYNLIRDIAHALDLDEILIKDDGNEAGWPLNSTLSLKKVQQLGYPTVSYPEMLKIIKADFLEN